MNRFQITYKRVFDIIAATLVFAVLTPIMFFIILAMRISSLGPLFFIQSRIGLNGRIFSVVKFRTMIVGGEKKGTITTFSDTRITPVGRWLRRFKLDEYPQLWNVIVGKMSLVGPRPDVPGYADRLIGRARGILSLRPGITGLATLYFRNEEKLLDRTDNPKSYNDQIIYPAKVALNLSYMEQWSFFRDIGYIIITLIPSLDRFLRLIPTVDIDELAQKGINAYREQ